MGPGAAPAPTWLSATEAADLLGITPRAILKRIRRKTLVAEQTDGEWHVLLDPVADSAAPSASSSPGLAAEEIQRRIGRFDPDTRDAFLAEAARRAELLDQLARVKRETVLDASGQRVPSDEVQAIIASWPVRGAHASLILAIEPSWAKAPTLRSLQRARAALHAAGGSSIVLIPAAPTPRDEDPRCAVWTPEMDEHFRHLCFDAHPHATDASIHRHLVARFGAKAPSVWWVRRKRKMLPHDEQVFERKGERTYSATAVAPIRRDYESIDVGEWWCGDHHELDLFCIDPTDRRRTVRPWLTMWQDLRSRAPAGWAITVRPDSQSIAEAFAHGVVGKTDDELWSTYLRGLPQVVYVDNGQDYRSKRLHGERRRRTTAAELANPGLFRALGVEVAHALPYNAKAKPVERLFGTIAQQFSRDFPTYCGSNPSERTERERELHDVHAKFIAGKVPATPFLGIEEIRRQFMAWVIRWIRQPSDAAGFRDKTTGLSRTPLQIAATRRLPIRDCNVELLAQLAWPREVLTSRNCEIRLGGHFYQHQALRGYHGQRVVCLIDPTDYSRIAVLTTKGAPICWATSLELAKFVARGETVDREFIAAAQKETRDRKRALEQGRKARRAIEAGVTPLEAAVERLRERPAPAPLAPAPTPPGVVHTLPPAWTRSLPPPPASLPAPVPGEPALPEETAIRLRYELGHGARPVLSESFDPVVRQQELEDQQAWDEGLARRLAHLTPPSPIRTASGGRHP